MTGRLVSLETWLKQTYGDDAPSILTARRWARDGHIDPAPRKHGRAYFVSPNAAYVAGKRRGGKLTLIDRIGAANGGKAA